jgi:uncharacterized membrane protein
LQEALGQSVRSGFERSPARDVAHSSRKVVDVAVRALSSGINDPTTAVHALSHASTLLGDLVSRRLSPDRRADDDGVVRLVVPQWPPVDLVDLVLEEPLHYASGQPTVLRRMAALLREVAWRAPRGVLDDVLRDRLRDVVDVAAESTRITASERRSREEALHSALVDRWPADLTAEVGRRRACATRSRPTRAHRRRRGWPGDWTSRWVSSGWCSSSSSWGSRWPESRGWSPC